LNCLTKSLLAAAAALSTCAGSALSATPAASAPAASLPAELFAAPPDMDRPILSPQGDALAVLVRDAAGRRELAVIDISNPESPKMNIAARSNGADISGVEWADNSRLVFRVDHELESLGDRRGGGTWAVDRSGEHARQLRHDVGGVLHDGSGDVIAYRSSGGSCYGNSTRYHCEGGFFVPLRLDTRTDMTKPMVDAPLPEHPVSWLIDGAGQVRGVVTEDAAEVSLFVPPGGPGAWKRISHYKTLEMGAGIGFQGFGADGRLYVNQGSTAANGADTLHVMDLATGKITPEPIVSVKGFDFSGTLVQDWGKHRVLGVHYVADADGTVWFDAEMGALQDRVDQALPGLINMIDAADCGCAQRVLVTSWSDRQPAQFRLFDRKSGQLTPIGGAHPDMRVQQMARTTFERIAARDGHDLPVYVTRPAGKGPWPTVVVVHGGPFLRGWDWRWDAESQFLASRGYLVVKPEFRGSMGYGNELFVSGMKQWGLKMQDDIADATIWAAKKGWADPARTCIEGASYGGYAALMGLVRYPELYRCGIASAAVTDLNLMYDVWWSDSGDEWKNYGMPAMVGDPVKDAAQFTATSPIAQASRITHPLMLAHGGLDRRVPIEHAQQLRDALVAQHAPLTWVLYRDEGHGWYKPDNRADWYRRMEAFLATNDGPLPAKP
jgi:dienelactone hydrolase